MKIKELLKAILFQLKEENAFRDIFITKNAFGIFSINSHINAHANTGKPKQMFKTEEGARKAAESLSKKYNTHFSTYKCAFCEGYHIGKNKRG